MIDNLSQDVILGVSFMQQTGALLDYKRKRIIFYDGAVNVPLRTTTNPTQAVRTVQTTRIPAFSEAIIPVKLPSVGEQGLGITGTLPQTSARGISVAGALVDRANEFSACRILNPTSKVVCWPTGHAFAYIDPCLLYTSPSPRDRQKSRMPSSA